MWVLLGAVVWVVVRRWLRRNGLVCMVGFADYYDTVLQILLDLVVPGVCTS